MWQIYAHPVDWRAVLQWPVDLTSKGGFTWGQYLTPCLPHMTAVQIRLLISLNTGVHSFHFGTKRKWEPPNKDCCLSPSRLPPPFLFLKMGNGKNLLILFPEHPLSLRAATNLCSPYKQQRGKNNVGVYNLSNLMLADHVFEKTVWSLCFFASFLYPTCYAGRQPPWIWCFSPSV